MSVDTSLDFDSNINAVRNAFKDASLSAKDKAELAVYYLTACLEPGGRNSPAEIMSDYEKWIDTWTQDDWDEMSNSNDVLRSMLPRRFLYGDTFRIHYGSYHLSRVYKGIQKICLLALLTYFVTWPLTVPSSLYDILRGMLFGTIGLTLVAIFESYIYEQNEEYQRLLDTKYEKKYAGRVEPIKLVKHVGYRSYAYCFGEFQRSIVRTGALYMLRVYQCTSFMDLMAIQDYFIKVTQIFNMPVKDERLMCDLVAQSFYLYSVLVEHENGSVIP